MAGYTLSPDAFAEVFPFHLGVNTALEIVQVGPVLQRLYPWALLGEPLAEHFTLLRPKASLSFQTLVKHQRRVFLLASRQSALQLKGQMQLLDGQDIFLFLCSLWVSDKSQLTQLGVKLTDFATHDPMVDFLFLQQTHNATLSDTKNLNQILENQSHQLQIALDDQEKLTQQATQRTQQLKQVIEALNQTQVQLIQAEKMSGLGQLVAGITHEINNPVNFILGNISHAQDYALGLIELIDCYQREWGTPSVSVVQKAAEIDIEFIRHDFRQLLHSITVGAERINKIVESLRLFSRLDEAEFKSVELHHGLESTLTLLNNRLQSRLSIQVIKTYEQPIHLECYAGQLNQVFMSILLNAIEAFEAEWAKQNFSIPKQPKIHIRTQQLDAARVRIVIADNGPGIPAHICQRIFDPFFTTKPVGEGTGMGLAISYQIVAGNHQGSLLCQSEPGDGSIFTIEIPTEQTTMEQAAMEQAAMEQAAMEQTAMEQAAMEQAAMEQTAMEQTAMEQTATGQTTMEQTTMEQTTMEQMTMEQTATGQLTREQTTQPNLIPPSSLN